MSDKTTIKKLKPFNSKCPLPTFALFMKRAGLFLLFLAAFFASGFSTVLPADLSLSTLAASQANHFTGDRSDSKGHPFFVLDCIAGELDEDDDDTTPSSSRKINAATVWDDFINHPMVAASSGSGISEHPYQTSRYLSRDKYILYRSIRV